MDNTEQQAVPVAQEVLERLRRMISPDGRLTFAAADFENIGSVERETVKMAIDYLASLPCKSGEGAGEIEQLAQFLHDEGGFGDAMTDRTWPEHDGDTGQRGDGWVKIVPSDVVAKFRDVARRWLLPRAAITPDATQTREAEGEQFAKIAECAFDDRPRSRVGHPSQMDWDDGYRDGTRAAASAIRAALNGRGGA